MARKRALADIGPSWGYKQRLADEARQLARVVREAGGSVDDVLGQATLEEAAATREVDVDELRAAIECELGRRLPN